MKSGSLITCVFSCLICFGSAFSQVLPEPGQISAWHDFNERNGHKWSISWDNHTGSPGLIHGLKSVKYPSIKKHDDVAVRFLKDHRTIFGMKPNLSDLPKLRSMVSNGVHVVDFQQLYEGLPILGAEYSVAVDEDRAIQMAAGKYFRTVSCETKPSITKEQAVEIALKETGLKPGQIRDSAVTLAVLPKAENFILSYRVWLNQWELIVDATDGTIIDRSERISRANGRAYVYSSDPTNGPLIEVTIPRLLGGGYRLDGTFVRSTNAELGDAYSPTSDFRFIPPPYGQHDNTHFDDANVYYHVDKFAAEYWPEVGYAVPFKVTASVHDPYPYGHDNAAASASSCQMWFGHGGSLFNDFAKKGDVIYHEYTHIVSGRIGLGYSGEAAALNEGYSDYHAASFTNDPQIGEWVTKNNPDLRTLATSPTVFNYQRIGQFSYYINAGAHLTGMVWSGTLWDLRKSVGANVSNFLAYQGLVYRHGSASTFLDARDGLLLADQYFYGSAHANTIKHILYLRGIGPDYYHATIAGPAALQFKQTGTYTADVSGGSGNYSYRWYSRAEPGGSWQALGTARTQSKTMLGADFSMRVDVRDVGANQSTSISLYVKYGTLDPRLVPALNNYPNPFNPTTVISYKLDIPGPVTLKVYDVLGREVSTLVDGRQTAGTHEVNFNGSGMASGVYFYRLTGPGGVNQIKKMLLTK